MGKIEKNWGGLLTITLIIFITIFLVDDNDIRIFCYIFLGGIILVVTFFLWFKTTMDDINNEEQKTRFLNEEFDYLVNSVVEGEGFGYFWLKKRKKKKVKYKVTDIIISPPRKIQEDEWEVSIEIYMISPGFQEYEDRRESFKILNISDTELEEIMNNKKGLKSFINPVKKVGVLTILNPDVLKKDEN